MQTKILEQKLRQLLVEALGPIDGGVKLGDSVRTWDQWNRAGYRITKGQKAVKIKVGESMRFYFFRSQVWHLGRYLKYVERKKNLKKNNFEPSGAV